MRQSFVRSCLGRQILLVVLCCCACGWIRFVVQSETVSDLAELAIQALGTFALLGALFVTARAACMAPSRSFHLALAVSPLAVAVLGGAFLTASYADVSCELQALIEAREPNVAQTSVVVGPTGQDIRLSGVMREGAALRLEKLLQENPDIKRIHLTSEGGLADEGQAVGEVIAAHRMTTYVPDYCVSACTLAFIRGRERLMQKDARVGFHAPYVEGLFGQIFQDDASAERSAYIAAGVTTAFANKALAVASGDMWFPDTDRLIAAHVATGVVDRYHFPASGLDGAATIAGARDEILQNFPFLQAVANRAPDAFNQIASGFLDDYRRGASEGEALDAFKTRVAGTVAGFMGAADDQTVLAATRYLARAMAVAPPQECTAIASRRDLLRASSVLSRADQHAEAEAGSLLDRILRSANAGGGLVHKTTEAPIDMSCDEWRETYARILGLPDARRAVGVRAMLALTPAPTLRTASGTRAN